MSEADPTAPIPAVPATTRRPRKAKAVETPVATAGVAVRVDEKHLGA